MADSGTKGTPALPCPQEEQAPARLSAGKGLLPFYFYRILPCSLPDFGF
jgi:hypothetical protein